MDRFRVGVPYRTGGQAQVFSGVDLQSGEPVAVKVASTTEGRAADGLRSEAVLLHALSHSNIVRVLGSGQDDTQRPWIALEWIDGGSLAERIQKFPLSADEVLVLGCGLARALEHAHRCGLVHRDLKPANILLRDGDPARPVVVDFGLAWHASQGDDLAAERYLLGTPHYMAPEQARALTDGKAPPLAPDLYPRADLHALGAVLYTALTGSAPYRGAHPLAVLGKVLLDPPPVLSEACRQVPRGMDQLVQELLAKEPGERPESAARVLERLQVLEPRVLEESAPPPSLSPSERGQVSVLLLSSPGGRTQDYETSLTSYGAEVHALDEQVVVAVFARSVGGSERTLRAASCAESLRKQGELALTLVTGLYRPDAGPHVGALLDRALGLHDAQRLGEVTLDETSAGLLEARYELRSQDGRTLLGQLRRGAGLKSVPLPTLVPFVGRDRELATLAETWRQCCEAPRSRAVLTTGQAGSGKSRLCEHFTETLDDAGRVLVARCDPVSGESPYALVAQLVGRLASLPGQQDPEGRRQALMRWTRERLSSAEDAARVAVFVGELVDAGFPDHALPILRDVRLSPQALQVQIRNAFEQFVEAALRESPLLLLVHDLQWADAPSVHLLHALLRNLNELPLMILANARPEVSKRFDPLWPNSPPERMRVGDLPSRQCRMLVKELGLNLQRPALQALVRQSEGNPFYLLEFLRQIDSETGELPAPKSVLSLVTDRLEACEPLARRLLRVASVFGDRFWHSALTDLLEAPDAEVSRLLGLLVEDRLVQQALDSRFEPDAEYHFSHALVREAASASLIEEERPDVHRAVATWLRKQNLDEPRVIAEHLRLGELPEQAIDYYEKAARRALRAGHWAAVVELAAEGLRCGAREVQAGQLKLLQAEALNWQDEFVQGLAVAKEAADSLPLGSADWAHALEHASWGSCYAEGSQTQSLHEKLVEGLPEELEERHVSALAHCVLAAVSDTQQVFAERVRAWCATHSPSLSLSADARFMEAALLKPGSRQAAEAWEHCASVCRALGNERIYLLCQKNLAADLCACGQYTAGLVAAEAVTDAKRRAGMTDYWISHNALFSLAESRQGHPVAPHVLRQDLVDGLDSTPHLSRPNALFVGLIAYEQGDYPLALDLCNTLLSDHELQESWLHELAVIGRALRSRALRTLAQYGAAQQAAEETAQALERRPLQIFAEFHPLVQLALAEAEYAAGDTADAHARIRAVATLVRGQAAEFDDPEWAHNFLQSVPEHGRILELEEAWDGDGERGRS